MAAQHTRRAWPTVVGAAAFAASVVLVPAGAAAQDGPETPVVGLLQAISDKRFGELGQFFCPEFANQSSGFDLGAEMTASMPPGIDPQLVLDALTISVSGPSGEPEPLVSVIAEDTAATLLGVEATLTIGLDSARAEPLVRAIVENELQAQGMELTEEGVRDLIEVVSTQLSNEVGERESIEEVAEVRPTSDGRWLICGGTIVETDALPLPSAQTTPGASPSDEAVALVPATLVAVPVPTEPRLPSAPAAAKDIAGRWLAASSDEQRRDVLLDVLSGIGMGVYTMDGRPILYGAEQDVSDPWLYDFEVAIASADPALATPVSVADTAASLDGVIADAAGNPMHPQVLADYCPGEHRGSPGRPIRSCRVPTPPGPRGRAARLRAGPRGRGAGRGAADVTRCAVAGA